MLATAVLYVPLDPVLRLLLAQNPGAAAGRKWLSRTWPSLLGGRIRSEEYHPITGPLIRFYDPIVRWTLRRKTQVIVVAVLIVVITLPLMWKLGSEFMPPLDEGAILYMPTTMPGSSIAESQKLLRTTDAILKSFTEVDHVLGKTGRADSATD